MNCKPGQRALLWRNSTPTECFDAHIGLVVTVGITNTGRALHPITGVIEWSGPAWSFDSRITCKRCGWRIGFLPDCDLKPLPDEGDVAKRDALEALREVSRQMDENIVPASTSGLHLHAIRP